MECFNYTYVSADELRLCTGDEIYNKIMRQFSGRHIYINKSVARFENPFFKMKTNERNKLLLKDYQSGIKAKELSEKYCLQLGYTYNLIQQLMQKANEKKDVASGAE